MRLIDADALKRHYSWWKDGTRELTMGEAKSDFDVIVDLQPIIEAEPRWIPCSERLPEENEAVNVTWVNHLPENYYKSIKDKPFTATAVFYRGDWYWWSDTLQDYLAEYGLCPIYRMDRAIEVIAWMPLPEPYSEVEE